MQDHWIDSPTIECMAEGAFELAKSNPDQWRLPAIARGLARLGYFDLAQQFIPWADRSENSDFIRAQWRSEIVRNIARQQVVLAARKSNGSISFEPLEALFELPFDDIAPWVTVSGSYSIATLDLLGQNPFEPGTYLWRAIAANQIDTNANKVVAEQMTRRFEEIISEESGIMQESAWRRLSKLYALLDDRDNSIRALKSSLPLESPNWWVSDVVVRTDPNEVLHILNNNNLGTASNHLLVARAMIGDSEPPSEIAGVLLRGFSLAELETSPTHGSYTGFSVLRGIVTALAEIGYEAEAERLAGNMNAMAHRGFSITPWVNTLQIVATYIDLGLPDEANEFLDEAVRLLPKTGSRAVLAGGFTLGPVKFWDSKSGSDTYASFAAQFARLGDLATFDKYMAPINDEHALFAWKTVFSAKLSYEEILVLLSRVEAKNKPAVIAHAAATLFEHGDSSGVHALITLLFENVEGIDYDSYRTAALLGILLEDADIQQKSLSGLLSTALQSDDPLKIVKAAVFWKVQLPLVQNQ